MIKTLENSIGKPAKRRYLPKQAGDVEKTHADISKGKQMLNFYPKIDFKNGISKFIEWKMNLNADS
jgi:UDP-glucuronate 4-epimerase